MNVVRGDADGVPMRWLEAAPDDDAAAGPPVVLIHGIPTSPALWRRVVPLLDGHRVLAWEMVGYGDSIPAGRDRDISVARQAEHLDRWLASIGVDRAVLVGHDLGGGVAQIAAVRYPDRCAGLVLTQSIAYDSWPVAPMRLLRAGGALFGRIPSSVWEPVFIRVLAEMHADRQVGRASAALHWAHYDRHGGPRGLVRQARSLDTRDTLAVADELDGIDVPARVVWGDAGRFQPIRYGARLATALGTAVRAIPGGRHFTPEDHPQPIASAIEEVALLAG